MKSFSSSKAGTGGTFHRTKAARLGRSLPGRQRRGDCAPGGAPGEGRSADLVFPAAAYWWLEHYTELGQYLETRHQAVARGDDRDLRDR